MSEQNPTNTEVLNAAIAKRLLELHTIMPGQILAYNPDERTAKVQPCPRRKFRGSADSVPLPVLPRVPVAFPGGGGMCITWPLLPGDSCLIGFAERDLEKWADDGGVYDPLTNRRHNLSDGIVLPLVATRSVNQEANATELLIGKADGTAMIKINIATGEISLASASVKLQAGEALGNFLTTLHSAIAGWTPVPNDGGAALKTALAAWLAQVAPS